MKWDEDRDGDDKAQLVCDDGNENAISMRSHVARLGAKPRSGAPTSLKVPTKFLRNHCNQWRVVTTIPTPQTTQSEQDPQAKHLNPDGKEILKDRTKDRDEELKLGTQQPEGRMEIYVSRAPRSLLEILMDVWLNNPTAGFLREILPRMKISQAWIQSHIWFLTTKTPVEIFRGQKY